MKSLTKSLQELNEEPFASIMCYPRYTDAEIRKRLAELRKLNVKALEFSGQKHVFNVPVLGKGCVGIVTIAYRGKERTALKIRRVDADRSGMRHEAKLLRKANSVNVGPKLLGVSRNFLLMQFADGALFPTWLVKNRSKKRLRMVLHEILEQCWRLDEMGLDHGELSHAPKHLIVNQEDECFIVDFETASLNRRPSNVTSACQFLFLGSETAKIVAKKLGRTIDKGIVESLRRYKNDRSRGNFEMVLEACGLNYVG